MANDSRPLDAAVWFRVLMPSGALGPGKIALMQAIATAGSVSGAARSLRMSHARSVKLVAEINGLAPTPLIDTRAGGQSGGGASLTPLGRAVLEAYAELDRQIRDASAPALDGLTRMLTASQAGDSHL